jgi:hypothetical protein
MKIEDGKGAPIKNLAGWAKLYDTPQSSHQWKEHRSAYSTAEFILNRSGAESLRARIADAVGEQVEFEKVIPEYEVRFDAFGKGRMHDLAIFGKTDSGRSLFVGVEAKVDESFGDTVRDAYLKAKAKQIAGKPTNAPERIEELLKLHFAEPDPTMFDVRYQLLYATAGTIAAKADVSVLYVAVFKTPLYSETKSAENYRDYVDFMGRVGAETLKLSSKEAQGHRLFLQGKQLVCLYEHFEL